MSINKLKRRRADDLHAGPSVSRKLSSHSGVKKTHGDEKYRRQMYSSSVQDALRKKSEGDSSKYDQILRRFTAASALKEVASTQELHLLINALSHVVSQLDRRHKTLVTAIITLQWASADASFVKSYTSFMGLLLSAQSQYGTEVLERAVEGLTHQSDISVLNLSTEASGKRLTRGDLYDRYHQLLEDVLSIVPTLAQSLHQVIARKFPHKRLAKIYHITYIRNVLRIAKYCPGLADQIVASIVEQAIQIDVECQVDMDELEQSGETFNSVFDLDPFESEVSAHANTEADPESDEEQEHLSDLSSEDEPDIDDVPVVEEEARDHAHLSDMAMKLDAILAILFDHLGADWQAPASSLQLSPDDDERLFKIQHARFRALLFTFERVVLRTAKTRYTQFLLFWYSSLDPQFTDEFLGTLLNKAIRAETPATRAAAASYLASFVSRARFVNRESVRHVMRLLCTYLGEELEQYAEQKEAVHISHFTSFYSASQAVFLMFCFRWRDLQDEQEEQDHEEENDDLGLNAAAAGPKRTKWITELDIMQKVVVSPLNPLKFCDESVVEQFASVAAQANFTSCYSILDQNRRTAFNGVIPSFILPASSTVGSNAGSRPEPNRSYSAPAATPSRIIPVRSVFAASNPLTTSTTTADTASTIMELNGFFPFDPYDLHQSRTYIDPIYRRWDDVKIEGDDEDEEADTEDEEEEASPVDSLSNGSASSLPLVFGSHPEARTSADELGKSFGGMSISPVRQTELPKSFLSLRA